MFFFWHSGGLAPLFVLVLLGGVDAAVDQDTCGPLGCVCEFLGEQSYAMYILQQWTFGMIQFAVGKVGPALPQNQQEQLQLMMLPPVLLVVGHLAHTYVEVPYYAFI